MDENRLLVKDGVLYEVNGSHCSCYGYEDQFCPEATTPAAIRMRYDYSSFFTERRDEIEAALARFENGV